MSGPSMSDIDLRMHCQRSIVLPDTTRFGVPDRRHHALETSKQHRSRQVHGLIGLPRIALGRFTRREICKPGLVEVEAHQLGHSQRPVAEMKSALERVRLMLCAVACEMDEVRQLDPVRHALHRGTARDGLNGAVERARLGCILDVLQLFLYRPQPLHGR
jgi:hypothetical protein